MPKTEVNSATTEPVMPEPSSLQRTESVEPQIQKDTVDTVDCAAQQTEVQHTGNDISCCVPQMVNSVSKSIKEEKEKRVRNIWSVDVCIIILADIFFLNLLV